MKGTYKLIDRKLVPHDPVTEKQQGQDLSEGDIVNVEIRKPRNPGHHRKAFALLQLVYENLPEKFEQMYPTFDAFLTDIKLKCGWYDKHLTYKRVSDDEWQETVLFIPKSISFGSMDQTEFRGFYDRMYGVILDQYMPDIDNEALEIEVLNFESRGSV